MYVLSTFRFLPYRKVLRQKDVDWGRTEGSSWSVKDTFLLYKFGY